MLLRINPHNIMYDHVARPRFLGHLLLVLELLHPGLAPEVLYETLALYIRVFYNT